MSGIRSSASIEFDKQTPLKIEVHSFTSNTLSFFSDTEDTLSYASLYISATPEQFRQIGAKCLKFAETLELKAAKQIVPKEANVA